MKDMMKSNSKHILILLILSFCCSIQGCAKEKISLDTLEAGYNKAFSLYNNGNFLDAIICLEKSGLNDVLSKSSKYINENYSNEQVKKIITILNFNEQ